jgi:hypothetical protein
MMLRFWRSDYVPKVIKQCDPISARLNEILPFNSWDGWDIVFISDMLLSLGSSQWGLLAAEYSRCNHTQVKILVS